MFKLPNRVVQNWAQVQTNFLKLEEWLNRSITVSNLPSSPLDGDRVLYQPSVGVVWDLVFNQAAHDADGYGWVVLGGTPLSAESSGLLTSTSASWADGGLDLAIPHDGKYDVTIGARLYSDTANNAAEMSTSGAGTSDGQIIMGAAAAASAFVAQHNMRTQRFDLTADTLAERYRRGSGSGEAYLDYRSLRAMPVRLAS